MAQITRDDIKAARVLHEDDDFITLEVGKHDDVKFTLDEETPDRFLTLLFCKMEDGEMIVWTPWEDG